MAVFVGYAVFTLTKMVCLFLIGYFLAWIENKKQAIYCNWEVYITPKLVKLSSDLCNYMHHWL